MTDPRHDADCFEQLGIKDPTIYPNDLFSASSKRESRDPYNARLDLPNAWCPTLEDSEATLRIEIPDINREIYGVVAQGLATSHHEHFFIQHLRIFRNGRLVFPRKNQVCHQRFYYMNYSVLWGFWTLIKLIIAHVKLFMVISHVKIIALQPTANFIRCAHS